MIWKYIVSTMSHLIPWKWIKFIKICWWILVFRIQIYVYYKNIIKQMFGVDKTLAQITFKYIIHDQYMIWIVPYLINVLKKNDCDYKVFEP